MPQENLFSKIKGFLKKFKKNKHHQEACVELSLPGLFVKFNRKTDIKIPHELTVVLPRTEIRKKCLNDDCSKFEYVLIYSSITIVDAPIHPLAGPTNASRKIPPHHINRD